MGSAEPDGLVARGHVVQVAPAVVGGHGHHGVQTGSVHERDGLQHAVPGAAVDKARPSGHGRAQGPVALQLHGVQHRCALVVGEQHQRTALVAVQRFHLQDEGPIG